MIKRSCKGNNCIGYYKAQIDEIRPELTWNDCAIIGAQAGRELSLDELHQKMQELKRQRRNIPVDVKYPTAIQVCIADDYVEDVEKFEEKIKKALELSRLQSGLEIELLLHIVLDKLKSQVLLVGDIKEPERKEDLTGPEMVKILVQILMLNREQDKKTIEEVKTALLKWEE